MSSTLTSYTIPPLDSQFSEMPGFPSIRQTPTASWPSVLDGSTIPAVPFLSLNKVYFTKKELKQTLKRYDASMQQNEVAQIWEIPFSVDVNEPVTELTQKIQAVMVTKKIYKHWDINFNTFLIIATQVTYEWDTIR